MAVISMKKNEDFMGIKDGFDEFIRTCRARNLSNSTVVSYEGVYKQFRLFYSKYDRRFDGDIGQITDKIITEFIEELQERDMKPVSINSYLRHMKAIFNFWSEKGYMRKVHIQFLKYQEEIKDVYSDSELLKMLKKPNTKKCTFTELRTWAVCNFFVGTGCRVGTLVALRINSIDFENGLINCNHTKNGKPLFVPLSDQLALVLIEFLKTRGGEPDDFLFPSENNTKLLGTTVTHNIKAYNEKRGIRAGNCHLFRHTFAKNWILTGGDPLRLQKILGHSSLKMVQHYANIYKADLKVGFEDFNLLSKLTTSKRITITK